MSDPVVFMDTSALFAAILSPGGRARAVLIVCEMGLVSICVGRRVLLRLLGTLEAGARRKTLDVLAEMFAP